MAGTQVACWGYNGSGQLADGTNTSRADAATIPVNAELSDFYLGSGATPCARDIADVMWCWGWNSYGQLLNGTLVASRRPLVLDTPVPLRMMASGNSHLCGLDSLQIAWCWGRNDLGQAGNATFNDIAPPAPVIGGLAFVQFVAGADHSCGRTAGLEVWCWGSNALGQIGPDGGTASAVPVRVPLPPADTLVATRDHSCILSEGEAWCWGADTYGQLGQGNPSGSSPQPRQISGLRFQSISAGGHHTCGISEAGEAWCWGRNRYGGLGHGGYGDSSSPVKVAYQRR